MTLLANIAAVSAAVAGAESNSAGIKRLAIKTPAFKTLAFKTLAFKARAFKTLAFKARAFKTLAFKTLAKFIPAPRVLKCGPFDLHRSAPETPRKLAEPGSCQQSEDVCFGSKGGVVRRLT
jgi:hypothetical protein